MGGTDVIFDIGGNSSDGFSYAPDSFANSFQQMSLADPNTTLEQQDTFIIEYRQAEHTMYEVPGYPGIYIPLSKTGGKNWRGVTCSCRSLGLARRSGQNFICVHNCLATNFPRYVKEWHYEKNYPLRPEDVLPGCASKFWWKCQNSTCGHHEWISPISHRTGKRADNCGCPFCKGYQVCPCDNAAVRNPRMAAEYHPTLNTLPLTSYSRCARAKVWWQCLDHTTCKNHVWFSSINSRTQDNTGCPFCSRLKVCPCDNVAVQYPRLIAEYHPVLNTVPLTSYSRGSSIKVWWKCLDHQTCDKHVWQETIVNRSTHNYGCPFCNHNRVCPCNNAAAENPWLAIEYHPCNELPLTSYSRGSGVKVWWRCSNHNTCDKHVWSESIYNRASVGLGCPFCVNYQICDCNHLGKTHPHLATQWHPDNSLPYWKVTHGSSYVAWWICSNHKSCDKHVWSAPVCQRTSKTAVDGCPFCSSRQICDCNNLKAIRPDIAALWHPTENDFGPETVFPYSSKRAWFLCRDGHASYSMIYCRTIGNYCLPCSKTTYSQVAIKWIQRIEQAQGITIRHALSEGGEFPTPVGKVDGFCEETNTVYEYHGTYWHGHPSLEKDNDVHHGWKDGRTFADVYRKSMTRDANIRALGYNLVIMWEHEDDGTNIRPSA